MQGTNHIWTKESGWQFSQALGNRQTDLILAFGSVGALTDAEAMRTLRQCHIGVPIASVSTAGEIVGDVIVDDSIVALAICFEKATVRSHLLSLEEDETSEAITRRLADRIDTNGLAHILLFCDGLHINAATLTTVLSAHLPAHVAVTGGLAADGDRFSCTYVGLGENIAPRQLVAIALYGESLRVGFGSVGGWKAFGPERVVTRSTGTVLCELDGEPALALYKRYLGDSAADLPASALRFPLALLKDDGTTPLVRTILSIDEKSDTMTFASDVPQGSRVQLMRASFDGLIDGAEQAARNADTHIGTDASVAILVSCVGRRLVLKQQTEDEIDGVRRILGDGPIIAGFYSYGEITPLHPGGPCELHNQTMTITTLSER